jgi:methylphosphotriester-DNA--protein-cysteine methyltransferase
MMEHHIIDEQLIHTLIRSKKVQWGGHKKFKIYGLLSCASGKRMKKLHRVFFGTEQEATQLGYRPCGNCLRVKYQRWKNNRCA